MRQYDAIEIITQRLKQIEEVQFIYIDGSLAINKEDNMSNINYFCGIDMNFLDAFKAQLINILEAYHTIIYYKEIESNKYIFVYDDSLILYFTILNYQDFLISRQFCTLYDPNKILIDKEILPMNISFEDASNYINDFSLHGLEFIVSYNRKDVVHSMAIANEMVQCLGKYLKYIDTKQSDGKIKKCFEALSKKHRLEYSKIIKELKYNSLLSCVQLMFIMVSQEMKSIPLEIGQNVNYDLFDLTKKEIFSN